MKLIVVKSLENRGILSKGTIIKTNSQKGEFLNLHQYLLY